MTSRGSPPFQTTQQGNVDYGGRPFAPDMGLSLATTPPGDECSADRVGDPTPRGLRANLATSIEAFGRDNWAALERLRSEACRYNPHSRDRGSV
jgi:hypothetical protein